MAVINFVINAKDTASKTIENVGKSFNILKIFSAIWDFFTKFL